MNAFPRKHVVVLSGAGISAESGLKTFRGKDGLWEGHRVEEVATPHAWAADPARVLRFYNERRGALRAAQPNAAHRALVDLEQAFDVTIVTQNVDDLHERAGSSRILHLHGELMKARSTVDESLIYTLGPHDIEIGDRCERGGQLRPHVVWFGELVPELGRAAQVMATADILIVVGTSLAVYPAASLIHEAPDHAQRFVVDPNMPASLSLDGFTCLAQTACAGLPGLVEQLLRLPTR
jgi:NAD-dependent deacetylase